MTDTLLAAVIDPLVRFAPRVLLVVATLVLGFLASVTARALMRWAVRKVGLEELGERIGASKVLYTIGARSGLAVFLGQVAFYIGLLLTFSAIAEILGLEQLAGLISMLTGYLPKLLVALLVLIAGFWLAGWLSGVVNRVGAREGRLASPQHVGQAIYYLVVVMAIATAADQAGLDIELVSTLIAIALGGARACACARVRPWCSRRRWERRVAAVLRTLDAPRR